MTQWPQLFEGWITLSTEKIAIQWINVDTTNHAIQWIVIYTVDSVIRLSNNPGLTNKYPLFEFETSKLHVVDICSAI